MPCSNNGPPAPQRTLLSPSELAVLNLIGFRMDYGCMCDAGRTTLSAGGAMPQARVSDWIEKRKGRESWAPASPVSDFWLDLKWTWWTAASPPTPTTFHPQLTTASLKSRAKVSPSLLKFPLLEFDAAAKEGFGFSFLLNPVALLISFRPVCKRTFKICSYELWRKKGQHFF